MIAQTASGSSNKNIQYEYHNHYCDCGIYFAIFILQLELELPENGQPSTELCNNIYMYQGDSQRPLGTCT